MRDDLNTYVVPPPTNETPQAGVHIPLLQALITGFLAGISVLSGILWYLHQSSPWAAGSFIFSAVTFYAWLTMLRRWESRLERLLGIDLNGSGKVGDEPQPPLRVIVSKDEDRNVQFVDVPQQLAEKMPAVAYALLSEGKQYTYETICLKGKLLTRPEWDSWNKLAKEKGWMKSNSQTNTRSGYSYTHAGSKVLEALESRYSPTGPKRIA